jgi:pyruvate dehydrogenase E2 component (dihydrolipoamide acetyltransferase)
MPVEVIMPKVDMDMATGKLGAWHVAEGETVAKGAPLFDMETDKSAMEVESPASGRLQHVSATPGEVVEVGKPIAWIYAEGEAVGARPGAPTDPAPIAPAPVNPAAAAPTVPDAAPAAPVSPAPASAPDSGPEALSPAPAPSAAGAVRATPAARKLARTAGVALGEVTGTGPHGRVQRDDVAKLAKAPPASEARPPREPDPAPEPLAAPVSWSVEPGDLFVSTRKGTGTPLVMIHGFAADSFGWMALERALPTNLPLIRIDLPNHGRSPRTAIRDFPNLLRSVRIAFDKAVDGEVHVLAHSLGGGVALALADVRPRNIASLTLIAPVGLGPEIDGAALNGIARASRTESLAPWLKRLTATPDGISWEFARAAMLSRNDAQMRAAQLDMADALFPDGVQSFDLRPALSRVTAPTSIVWGRGDHILPWRHGLAARGEMALHLLPEVGHIPHVECPDILAGILARNLRQTSVH